MSRTRRAATSLLPGRRPESRDGGFSLIEVIVALGLLLTVMATTAGFFTSSLKQSNGQTQAQEAAVLADQQLDYTRSVASSSLLSGRTQAAVAAAIASPPNGVDFSQDVTSTGNFDTASPPANSQAIPISMVNAVGGTKYTIATFIDQCYLSVAANRSCTTTDSGNGWIYRITVDVTYQLGGDRSCASNKPCYYVASTLRDPGTDPCFNVNVDFSGCSTFQPTITAISPNTVTTNSSTSVTLTGTNFDPGATVSIDTGGAVSNVNRISATSVRFTLTTDNTPAAVGTRTVKLTNPNGKFAYGTLAITTTAVNVASVSPSPVKTGTTTTLTIAGSGFQTGSIVSIPSTAGTIVGLPAITPTTITISFAASSSASAIGTWPVIVTNPDGNSDSANVTIQKASISVTAISPSTMAWGSTKNYTITGTGFDRGAQVTLDGTNVSETWVSSTSMTVTLSSDPSIGSRTFTVTNPDGGNASKTFSITQNPITVTGVSPGVTPSGSTKAFTITGSGFLPAATVTLDGSTVGTSSITSTLISLTLGSFPAAGSHTFTVTNPDGGSDTGTFTVTGSSTSSISSISPTSITHGRTVTVTITGTGFVTSGLTTPEVTVNGSTANVSGVKISSATKVTFKYTITSTKGTFTYPVRVTSKDGTVSDVFGWVVRSS